MKLKGLSFALLATAAALSGCSSSGVNSYRNTDRSLLSGTGISNSTDTRCGATLYIPGATNQYGGARGAAGGGYGGARGADNSPQMSSPNNLGAMRGNQGILQVLSVGSNPPGFARDSSSFAYGTIGIGNSSRTRLSGQSVGLMGISNVPKQESRMKFSSEGSILYVTLPDSNKVAQIGVAQNCAIFTNRPMIDVGARPREIATARTPRGEFLAIATDAGVALAIANDADPISGTLVAHPLGLTLPITQYAGRAISVAFSTSGEELYVGTERGLLLNFDINTITGTPRPMEQVAHERYKSYGGGVGTQYQSGHTPLRILANDDFLLSLDSFTGPRLWYSDTRGFAQSGGMTGNLTGRMQQGTFGGQGNDFRDMAMIAPNTVVALQGTQLITMVIDSGGYGGIPAVQQIPGDPFAFAIDPGRPDNPYTSEYLLIADRQGKIWTAVNNGGLLSLNTDSSRGDFTKIPGQPVAIAIRGPFVPISVAPSVASTDEKAKEQKASEQ